MMDDEMVEFQENIYYEQMDKPDVFEVTVAENASAEKCHLQGRYQFHVNAENFAIFDKKSNKRLYTWPFRYVRRYGKSSCNFQFEAGRKCPSGEGLFSLMTNEGDSETMFNLIQTRFQRIKRRDREFNDQPTNVSPELKTKPSSKSSSAPILPARKYENSEILPDPSSSLTQRSHQTDSKSLKRPPIASKPSIRKHHDASTPSKVDDDAAVARHSNSAAKASDINSLIGKNRDLMVQTSNYIDNTYSVMGREEDHASTAEYSSVYAQQARMPICHSEDDTYDEVVL